MRELLYIGPRDSLSALLARRLQADPETASFRQAAAPAPLPEGGGGSYAELLAGAAPGHARLVVVYRPPRRGGGGRGLPDLADAAALFEACAERPPAQLVLVASAAALEPHHQNPGLVAEPPRPARVRNPVARAWLELEERALRLAARAGGMRLTVLRPAAVAARDGDDYLTRVLRARLALPIAGHDPSVQLLAPEDLAQAVLLAVGAAARPAAAAGAAGAAQAAAAAPAGAAGSGDSAPTAAPEARKNGRVRVYHVAPAGVVPVRAALRLAGTRRLPLGRGLQRLGRAIASPLGWAEPIEQLDYLRYSATVGNQRIAEELGFAPTRTSAETIVEHLARTDAAGADAAPSTPPAAPQFDDYGMDRDYIAAFGRTLFHFLHRYYWRIEVRGLEHVPRSGRAMLVGVHRGFQPWDGVMALHTVVRGTGRHPRFLIHPTLAKFPFLSDYMTKLGGIIACQENGDWVLGRDEMVGMFPEGIAGAFTMYRDAYRLGKFGRDEFVKMALRNRTPLVPFVTAGSAEIYPIWGKVEWRWFRRFSEWPFLPLCPNFPLPGLPLPSKWHTQFLEPMPIQLRYGPEAEHDAAAVREISQEVRGRLQEALDRLRRLRRSIFYGSIFDKDDDNDNSGKHTATAVPQASIGSPPAEPSIPFPPSGTAGSQPGRPGGEGDAPSLPLVAQDVVPGRLAGGGPGGPE
jgi:1-acyl-sn-glycerol-3-phosphate acyltransferase/nucleoside-diphosphate-sugar epimerase